MRSLRVLLMPVAALTVLAGGCSESKPHANPVHGKITYKGAPVTGASVSFLVASEDPPKTIISATSDESGNYQLTTFSVNDGAPEGEYIVTVSWPAPKGRMKSAEPNDEPEGGGGADRLKGVYATRAKSSLRATVRKGDNEIDFKLP